MRLIATLERLVGIDGIQGIETVEKLYDAIRERYPMVSATKTEGQIVDDPNPAPRYLQDKGLVETSVDQVTLDGRTLYTLRTDQGQEEVWYVRFGYNHWRDTVVVYKSPVRD